MRTDSDRTPLITAGILLGVGLGGFVDGIILHQMLQWHHMVTVPYPATNLENLKLNTFWDSLFHVATWASTAIGLALLWRAGQRPDVPWSTKTFIGTLAMGWGLFNLVEGIIDHHILSIHHVREDVSNVLLWDLGFLAFGAILIAVGAALVGAGRREVTPPGVQQLGAARQGAVRFLAEVGIMLVAVVWAALAFGAWRGTDRASR